MTQEERLIGRLRRLTAAQRRLASAEAVGAAGRGRRQLLRGRKRVVAKAAQDALAAALGRRPTRSEVRKLSN